MAAIVMKNLELDDEDQADMAVPCVTASNKKLMPRYPWGLQICFDETTLKKLGIDPASCQLGGTIHGHFMATITSVSTNQSESGDRNRVELQIQKMAVESEDAENAEDEAAEAKPAARRRLKYS